MLTVSEEGDWILESTVSTLCLRQVSHYQRHEVATNAQTQFRISPTTAHTFPKTNPNCSSFTRCQTRRWSSEV